MRPRVLTISPYAAADPDFVAVSQTPAAGGVQELTLTADPVTLDFRRQIVITAAADETARTFVVTGTDLKGNQLVEAVAGPNATTASTVRAFTTVTSVKVDDDTAGAIEVGTGTVVSSNWLPVNYLQPDFKLSLVIDVGAATADLTVQATTSNILDYQGWDVVPGRGQHARNDFGRLFPDIHVFDHDTLVNVTADDEGNFAFPVRAVRLTSNAVLTGDDVALEVVQAGLRQ